MAQDLPAEQKHLPGEHDQETHGNRGSYSPRRLLIRGAPGSKVRGRTPPAAVPVAARPATTGPGGSERARRRRKGSLAGRVRPGPPAVPDVPAEFVQPPRDRPDSVRAMSDQDLADEYADAVEAGNEERMEQVEAELDRRDNDPDAQWGNPEEQQAFLASLNRGKSKAKTEREQAVDEYELYVETQYLRMESEAGALLSRAGKAAGISGYDLLRGFRVDKNGGRTGLQRSQINKYASEEALEWLSQPGNQRMTQTEFVNEWLGRATRADREKRAQPYGEN